MRSRYRVGIAVFFVLPLAVLAAGCGGGGGGSSSSTGSTSTGGGGGGNVSGKVTITGVWTGPEQQSFQAVLNGFKAKYPKVKVTYQATGDNTPTVLSTAVQGGNPPDLASVSQPGLVTDFPTSVNNVFANPPKAAMVIEGDFVPGVVASKNPLKPITGYNQFAFPSINGSKPAVMGGGDALIVFKNTPAVRALIKYLLTPQAATIWAKRGGFSSPNKLVKPSASESAPGGLNSSWTTLTTALIAPSCGSWRSMIRQITPAANSEIAIGMKTTVLNATAQLTFSVSTAKTSPIEVTSAGTTASQIALFLIAVTMKSLWKIAL